MAVICRVDPLKRLNYLLILMCWIEYRPQPKFIFSFYLFCNWWRHPSAITTTSVSTVLITIFVPLVYSLPIWNIILVTASSCLAWYLTSSILDHITLIFTFEWTRIASIKLLVNNMNCLSRWATRPPNVKGGW